MVISIKSIIFMIIMFHGGLTHCAGSVFIIIHGTWAAESAWYMSGGDFFDALEKTVSTKNSAVVSFCWSGGCGHEARLKAAYNLAKLISTYDKTVAIYVVAHSHGGNVAILASELLSVDAGNKSRIRGLYTLGTPVMQDCLPNMEVILYHYNFFSFEDLVQPLFGISQRMYPVHKRIANMRIFIDGVQPGHSALHSPVVAQWLPFIHQEFKDYLRQQNIYNTIAEPSIIFLDHTKAPEYVCDTQRDVLIVKDYQLSVLLLNSLRNSLDIGSSIPLTNR